MNRFSLFSLCSIIILLLVFGQLIAQPSLTLPQASQYAEVSQRIGLTDIKVTYHRPMVRGRTVWGDLVPYDQVWRAGANLNTTIEFTSPVSIGKKEIPAGNYGYHILPSKDEWTLILSSINTAWGSFSYDETEDVIRVKVKPESAPMTESLIYYFDNVTENSVDLVMQWDKLKVRLPIKIDVKEVVLESIRGEMHSLPRFFWQGWNQAANYCLQNDTNLKEAVQWADRSISMNKNFTNLNTKAGLLIKLGKTSEAEALIADGMEIATEAELNNYGYQLLFGGDTDEAIEIFKQNIKRFPDSWNVYDSLAEAYAANGETKLAIENYTKALNMTTLEDQKKRIQGVLDTLKTQ